MPYLEIVKMDRKFNPWTILADAAEMDQYCPGWETRIVDTYSTKRMAQAVADRLLVSCPTLGDLIDQGRIYLRQIESEVEANPPWRKSA